MEQKNTNDSNFTPKPSESSSVWVARKGDSILAESDSENGAWRLLGARGKKQRETLRNCGFEVVKA